jgi:hypothetical protein
VTTPTPRFEPTAHWHKGKQPRLPEPARRSISRRYAEGEVSLADLATEYSVGRSTIHRIIHGPETST